MLRRSLLYIPASSQKMLIKALTLKPDTIALDLEDGVAEIAKPEARNNLLKQFHELQKNSITPELAIRVNSVSALDNFVEDMKMLNELQSLPKTVLVPKVDTLEESSYIIDFLNKIYNRRPAKDNVNLITFVETAGALINMNEIFKNIQDRTIKSKKPENNRIIHSGCVFGSDDYCADMNIERTTEGLIFARQQIATICRVYNVDAIDMVNIDFKDPEQTGLKNQCIEGKRFGFSGKQLIHPNQIETCNQLFSPTEKQVEWATGLVAEFEKFSSQGTGAFTYKGQMIDKPLLRIANNILSVANR